MLRGRYHTSSDDTKPAARDQGLVFPPLAWPGLPLHDHQLLLGPALSALSSPVGGDFALIAVSCGVFGVFVFLGATATGWALALAINSLALVASSRACV